MSQTPKYKRFYSLMIEQNTPLFASFKKIHDQFAADRHQHATDFHNQGRKVLDVIRDWERRLCHGMEKGQYASYSAKLSEKFWNEVKKELPLIEEVGVITSK